MSNDKSARDLRYFDRFLKLWGTATSNPADRALHILMTKHREEVAPLFATRDPFWLHKAFRQTDVCGSADVDMMIWHLIHASEDFWSEVHFFFSSERHPDDKRSLKRRLAAAEKELEELRSKAAQP